MPIAVSPGRLTERAVRFETTGDVEFAPGLAELSAALERAADRFAAGEPARHLRFHMRHSTEERRPDELRQIAALISSRRPALSGKCAIVAARPVLFEQGWIFGIFLSGLGFAVEVFERDEEADEWLSE